MRGLTVFDTARLVVLSRRHGHGRGHSGAAAHPTGRRLRLALLAAVAAASLGLFGPVGNASADLVIPCDPGSFSADGFPPCTLADPGHFVAGLGEDHQSACEPGTFQPSAGQISCFVAPPGRFVPFSGAEFPSDCQPGSFQPLAGQTSCLPADPGHFVDHTGATSQSECPSGTFQPLPGQDHCITDGTPPLLTPANITINATSPAGATVAYTVTATDPGGSGVASVDCTPPSGTVFAIGDTTVDCTATDNVGNVAHASFTVHVKGAAEQLADLLVAVTGVGPGKMLADRVKHIQGHVARNMKKGACDDLNRFVKQVNDMAKGRKPQITAAQAASFTAQAQSIRAALGC